MNRWKLLGYAFWATVFAFVIVAGIYDSPEWAALGGIDWGVPIVAFGLTFVLLSDLASNASNRSSD